LVVKEPLPCGNTISLYFYRRRMRLSAKKQGILADSLADAST